jgi:hypothetical protein
MEVDRVRTGDSIEACEEFCDRHLSYVIGKTTVIIERSFQMSLELLICIRRGFVWS